MKVIICKNYDEISRLAADMIIETVNNKPDAVLGLATGSSPIGIYDYMVKAYEGGRVSFKNTVTANLDEYIGLTAGHDQSYRYFMNKHLFSRIDINKENTHFPDGSAPDTEAECARYNAFLNTIPRDVQLLGIGENGHIGFNEPGSPFDGTVNTVALKESTILANARFFSSRGEVPTTAVTMGIKNILDAKSIILVAMTTKKAEAVRNMIKGEISSQCPASALRLHGNVTVFLDKDAASLL